MLETLVNLHQGVADGGAGITDADWNTASSLVHKARNFSPNDLTKAITMAGMHLEEGDPVEAESCLNLALKQDMALDVRKLVEKAHEEVSIGNPEKGERLIEMALAELNQNNPMKTKLTQGKWVAGRFAYKDSSEPVIAVQSEYRCICRVSPESLSDATDNANASLIASATALYAALSQLISELPSKRDWLDPMLEKECLQVLRDAGGVK